MDLLLKILSTSVLTGLIASGFTIWFTRKNLKTSKYIETITTERIKWIQTVRNDFSELISSVLIHLNNTAYLKDLINEKIKQDHTENLVGAYRELTDEDLLINTELNQKIINTESGFKKILSRSEIVNKALLLKLRLNPKDDIEISKELDFMINNFSDYSKEICEIKIEISLLIDKVQQHLKREWEDLKTEVKKK